MLSNQILESRTLSTLDLIILDLETKEGPNNDKKNIILESVGKHPSIIKIQKQLIPSLLRIKALEQKYVAMSPH